MCNYFGLGRQNGGFGRGPAWYQTHPYELHGIRDILNTNQVNMDNVWSGLSFVTIYLLFVMLVMTAKGRKLSTMVLGSAYIFTLFALVSGFTDDQWYSAEEDNFVSTFCTFSHSLVKAKLKVTVGLSSFNVSYVSSGPGFYFNEMFELGNQESLKIESLKRGSPNPITVVAEYFSVENKVGIFRFARKMAMAGWYTKCLLNGALVIYIFGLIYLVCLPKLLPWVSFMNACSLIGVACVYWSFLDDSKPHKIYVDGIELTFGFGRTFYVVLAGGIVNLIVGLCVSLLLKCAFVGKISTCFELDYDTAWSAQNIKADSEKRIEDEKLKTDSGPDVVFNPNSFLRESMRRLRKSFKKFKSKDDHYEVETATTSTTLTPNEGRRSTSSLVSNDSLRHEFMLSMLENNR